MSDAPKGVQRFAVVVSRRWDDMHIRISVDDFGIASSMSLQDFVEALFRETAMDDSTKGRVVAAIDLITSEMKQETARVM